MKKTAADFPVGTQVRLTRKGLPILAGFDIPQGTAGEVIVNDKEGIIVRFRLPHRTWSADVDPREIEAKGTDLAAERQRAERQGGFDRPSAFDRFDQGGEE